MVVVRGDDDWVVVTQEGASLQPKSSDGVVEDLKDGVGRRRGRRRRRWVLVAREVGPVGTTDRAGDAAVSHI